MLGLPKLDRVHISKFRIQSLPKTVTTPGQAQIYLRKTFPTQESEYPLLVLPIFGIVSALLLQIWIDLEFGTSVLGFCVWVSAAFVWASEAVVASHEEQSGFCLWFCAASVSASEAVVVSYEEQSIVSVVHVECRMSSQLDHCLLHVVYCFYRKNSLLIW